MCATPNEQVVHTVRFSSHHSTDEGAWPMVPWFEFRYNILPSWNLSTGKYPTWLRRQIPLRAPPFQNWRLPASRYPLARIKEALARSHWLSPVCAIPQVPRDDLINLLYFSFDSLCVTCPWSNSRAHTTSQFQRLTQLIITLIWMVYGVHW